MQPTKRHIELAQEIDTWVKSIENQGGGDGEILQNSISQMAMFKELLDTTTHEQMDNLCETFPNFYHFAKIIENLAQGLHDGSIKAPTVN